MKPVILILFLDGIFSFKIKLLGSFVDYVLSINVLSMINSVARLRHVTPGYWAFVQNYTHKDIIYEIKALDRLSTDLGRSKCISEN